MKTIKTKVYLYSELSKAAKETARDWYRECVGSDWDGDTTMEDAKRMFAFAGFDIKDIHYSGFWSQGDGACFTGSWEASKVDAKGMRDECGGHDLELCRIADELAVIAARFPKADSPSNTAATTHTSIAQTSTFRCLRTTATSQD